MTSTCVRLHLDGLLLDLLGAADADHDVRLSCRTFMCRLLLYSMLPGSGTVRN